VTAGTELTNRLSRKNREPVIASSNPSAKKALLSTLAQAHRAASVAMQDRHTGEKEIIRARLSGEGHHILASLEADLMQTFSFRLAMLSVTLPIALVAAARQSLVEERAGALASLRRHMQGIQNARMQVELSAVGQRHKQEKAALHFSYQQQRQNIMGISTGVPSSRRRQMLRQFRGAAVGVSVRHRDQTSSRYDFSSHRRQGRLPAGTGSREPNP
jgi:hypothetical protein